MLAGLSLGVISTRRLPAKTLSWPVMAPDFLALSIWVVSALAKTSALAPWPSWVASWLEAPKLNVSLALGLACWKAVAMSWKTSVNEEAAKTTISPETGAAAAGFGEAFG